MIHLIVGNTGAGKTTYAKHLKTKTKGIVFSIDTWNKVLFLPDKKETDGLAWFLERIERAETILLDVVTQLQETKTDAILDLGLSKYKHREKIRQFAKAHNFDLTLHFLDIPVEVRRERVLQRNQEKGATFEFEVSQADFDFMENWFEPPTKEELLGGITVKQ